MSVAINVPPIEPFNPSGDTSSVHQRWERWVRSFELFSAAAGCKDSKQKRQLLLHCAGRDIQDIFFTFAQLPDEYDAAKAALDAHFKPIKNVPYERHTFRQLKQEDESVAQFVTRLRQLAVNCEFGESKDDFIRDQVIDKCTSNTLRTKLLLEKELTLQKCLDISAAREASEKHAADITSDVRDHVFTAGASAHATKSGSKPFRKKTNSQQQKKQNSQGKPVQEGVQCTRCGQRGHTGADCRCSRNVTCYKCNIKGHFQSMCLSKTQNGSGGARPKQRNTVHFVHTSDSQVRDNNNTYSHAEEEYSDDDYVFSMNQKECTKILIKGEPIEMVIDSGASCNILNSEVARQLRERGVEFTKTNRRIHPYGSPPLVARQRAVVDVQIPGQQSSVSAEFVVVPGSAPPLLGKETAQALGILHIGVFHVQEETNILDKYPELCDGIGKLKDTLVSIHIDKTVPPVARKHSRVPFHLRQKVADELRKLEDADIIEKVSGPTEWVSRIVVAPKPKNPDEIRLCVDMREANQAILRTRHVTPTVEELITDLNGASVFSKIDLRAGYHQLELEPSSRYITTFSTHAGLFRYKRLSFGINSAAEVFQHTIQTVIQGVHGARNVSDDIIVFGKTQQDHDAALHETLMRLRDSGLTVNRQKCEFNKSEVTFYGHIFSANGISPDPTKVQALKEARAPENVSELRSFLGMAQYSARFIPNFTGITEPLRRLTRNDTPWEWGARQKHAFEKLKGELSESATLAYFAVDKPIDVIVDASPVGLAALLSQEKPVCYASRALTDVESRYSQTEREALAVVWACEHFNIYLNGTNFRIVTDHKPLVYIFGKPNPPARIARWALRLQPYQHQIIYRPGKDNPADYLSRHPSPVVVSSSREQVVAEEFVNFVAETSTPVALTVKDIQDASVRDPVIPKITQCVRTGNWQLKNDEIDESVFVAYRNIRDELCVNAEQNLLLKGMQIVIPTELQDKVIQLAHEGHQGVQKTKAFIRSKVWFPGLNAAVEAAIQSCIPCQANSNRMDYEPLQMSELPKGPWTDLSIDFCGPLPSGDSLLVITDEYSRYPVVEIVRNTTAEYIIPIIDKVFSLFGYPSVVKSDNGPQFRSAVFQSFLKSCGVKHRRVTPLWPRANSQAEAFNKPLMKAVRAAHIERRSWKQELHRFCRMYRSTPHVTTQFTPHYLLFGAEPKTKIPAIVVDIHPADRQVRMTDSIAKSKMKQYADTHHFIRRQPINAGDTVLVKQSRQNKLDTSFNPTPLLVTNTKGSMISAKKPDGSTVTRNSSFFRRLPASVLPAPHVDADILEEEEVAVHADMPQDEPVAEQSIAVQDAVVPDLRRSSRSRQQPTYLKDYIQ